MIGEGNKTIKGVRTLKIYDKGFGKSYAIFYDNNNNEIYSTIFNSLDITSRCRVYISNSMHYIVFDDNKTLCVSKSFSYTAITEGKCRENKVVF